MYFSDDADDTAMNESEIMKRAIDESEDFYSWPANCNGDKTLPNLVNCGPTELSQKNSIRTDLAEEAERTFQQEFKHDLPRVTQNTLNNFTDSIYLNTKRQNTASAQANSEEDDGEEC